MVISEFAPMILTCPSCSTRYTVDEAKFPPNGRTVRCAKCGHSWHQPGVGPIPAPVAAPEPAAETAVPDPAMAEPQASPTRAFAPATAVPEEPAGQTLQMAAVAAGWIGLIVVVLLIGYSAVRYRQDIATIWPQSASVYSGLGLKVSAGGIDFDKVAWHRENEDGQPVLVVTGLIVNTSGRALPVPQTVRITLYDAGKRELFHWPVTPAAQTLKAGGTMPFKARLTNPPAAAREAVVTFAKDGA
jgi:predicted Zn finger-like uncharacterized protein